MSRTESLSLRLMTRAQIVAALTIALLSVAIMPSAGMPGDARVAQSRSPELFLRPTASQPQPPHQQEVPGWIRRGLPGSGHEALQPLVGSWRVRYEVYGTLGRRGDEPPIVSEDVTTRREWIGGGRFIEDTTEGTLMGAPMWRRGWLGYSNIDQRYEWVTIDNINTTMMSHASAPGSGPQQPISVVGAFIDQGVAGEETVGKRVEMRTVIRIDSNDRHMFELYFKRPGDKEVLALRSVYERVPR